MEKAEPAAVDPVQVTVGSGSDVEGEADLQGDAARAPQGYQHGRGAGGLSTADI